MSPDLMETLHGPLRDISRRHLSEEEAVQAVCLTSCTERPQSVVQLPLSSAQPLPGPVWPPQVGHTAVPRAPLSGLEAVRADHDAAAPAGPVQVEYRGAADVAHLSDSLVSSPPDNLSPGALIAFSDQSLLVDQIA